MTQTLPPLMIMGEDVNSFRYHTLVNRCPALVRSIISDNELDPETAAKLEDLATGLSTGTIPIPELSENTKQKYDFSSIQSYIGKPWLEGPWLHAECYLYHVICDIIGYHISKKDHFLSNKLRSDLKSDHPAVTRLMSIETIDEALRASLWGNRVDLSLFKVDDESRLKSGSESCIIANDSNDVIAHLKKCNNVHIVADNYGFEILCDLVLSDILLRSNPELKVTIHCKDMPYFVSDTSVADIKRLIECHLDAAETAPLRSRLLDFIKKGSLVLVDDPYWASPGDFRTLPQRLRDVLSSSDLTILKGDLNYRKLVSDNHWPRSTPFTDVVSYFPSPVCSLRTNKSEVVVGIDDDLQKRLSTMDPKWDVNGEFAVIQARL
eukprot:TRINITY_DN10699_c0_g2_i1.p1 TRINITY_DN10699_c0_g2~~TRINITY_DN10699_c0_g2_i1.p1  ORF type:complete len:392 (+),score=78.70 TRINITY_DN10699_c0_g2_i1:41-1177(+)